MTPTPGTPGTPEREALAALLRYAERNTCRHEETHRGGAIWTICDDCGMKWADDRGGFVPYEDPPEFVAAREALAASPAAGVLRPLKFDEEAAIDAELTRRGDDEGQGLDNYWKKAFREGWRARAMLAATPPAAPTATRGQKLAEAGYTRRPSLREFPREDDAPASDEREALTDEQIIKRCSEAGIQWLVPDADPDGFPGGFDMCGMAEMRKLLAATPPAAPAVEPETVQSFRQAGLTGSEAVQAAKFLAASDERGAKKLVNDFAVACVYGPDEKRIAAGNALVAAILAARAPQAAAKVMENGLTEAETDATASVAGLSRPTVQAEAVPALKRDEWQGGLTNDQLRAALQSKLRPGRAADDDDLTPFALGIEYALSAPLVGEPVQRRVRKTGGSFQHTGTVVAEFKTLAGQPRIVLEFDEPVAGMLHVYRPDQVEPLDAAPAPSAPAGEKR